LTKTLGDITSELTERVLSPAKSESERILREAQEKAGKIIADAEKEALNTRNRAREEAEQAFKQMEVDLKTAARNFILLLQERLEETIAHPTVEEEIGEALKDREFLKKIIEIVLQEFAKFEGTENKIEILLPSREKTALGKWFIEKFHQRALHNITVHFTDKVSFGFKIGFEDSGSHFNFGEGLVEAFREFCSPRFRKYFFTDNEG
jgi:V/A-type H+/Na+-transporting ATPase subunit E